MVQNKDRELFPLVNKSRPNRFANSSYKAAHAHHPIPMQHTHSFGTPSQNSSNIFYENRPMTYETPVKSFAA